MWIFCFDAKIFIAEATRKKVRSSFKMQFLCISIPSSSSSLVGNMMVGGGIARCLKITEKVTFSIASEASYVYILSRQKLIKNAKKGPFWQEL